MMPLRSCCLNVIAIIYNLLLDFLSQFMHFYFPLTDVSCSTSQEFLEEDFALLSEEKVEDPTSDYEIVGKDGKFIFS